MLISEMCKTCNVTKKALAYYEEQQLISPTFLENGYRDYSEEDASKVRKIVSLRKLGFSIPEIREGLEGDALKDVISKREPVLLEVIEKQRLARKLASDQDWDALEQSLEANESKQTIIQRFITAFPGTYGMYLSVHFSSFLSEPIQTDIQTDAYRTILDFLDDDSVVFPAELQQYFNHVFESIEMDQLYAIHEEVERASYDLEAYLSTNEEQVKQYFEYRTSDAFKQSEAFKMQKQLRAFQKNSGYEEIFIPAMRKLSPSYDAYMARLEEANKQFENA